MTKGNVRTLTRVAIQLEFLDELINDALLNGFVKRELQKVAHQKKIDEICLISKLRLRGSRVSMHTVVRDVCREKNMVEYFEEALARMRKIRRAYGKNRNKPPLTVSSPLLQNPASWAAC